MRRWCGGGVEWWGVLWRGRVCVRVWGGAVKGGGPTYGTVEWAPLTASSDCTQKPRNAATVGVEKEGGESRVGTRGWDRAVVGGWMDTGARRQAPGRARSWRFVRARARARTNAHSRAGWAARWLAEARLG